MDYSKIDSYVAACEDQKRDPKCRPDVSMLTPGLQKFINSAFELAIINRSLNKNEKGETVKANWTGEEWNHYPYFDVEGADDNNPSGSGLSLDVVVYVLSYTYVASRLTTREEGASEYSAKTFPKLWEDYLLDTED